MNSEIVGTYTHSDFGFVFARLGETLPRHPAQLYEAIAYFVLLVIGWLLYRTHRDKVGTGFFFGLCLTFIFVFRFGVEFFKEVQEPWELHMQGLIGVNQGQLLSVPFILVGLYCMFGCKLPHVLVRSQRPLLRRRSRFGKKMNLSQQTPHIFLSLMKQTFSVSAALLGLLALSSCSGKLGSLSADNFTRHPLRPLKWWATWFPQPSTAVFPKST